MVVDGRWRGGVDGRWRGGVDGRWRRGRSYSGSPHACKTGSGMQSNPPHPKVHDSSHKPHRIEELSAYLFFTTMALIG